MQDIKKIAVGNKSLWVLDNEGHIYVQGTNSGWIFTNKYKDEEEIPKFEAWHENILQ